jgi:ABC-2 type transport system permease protein
LAFTVLQPVVWMALFAQNFTQLADTPTFRRLGFTSYLSFFVPSILVLTVLNAFTLSGVSMITDVNTGPHVSLSRQRSGDVG